MTIIPQEIFQSMATQTVYLYGGAELIAAVSEEQLGALLDIDPDMLESFGDMVDPYRTLRGQGIGRQHFCLC
jgi:hypothetical protein